MIHTFIYIGVLRFYIDLISGKVTKRENMIQGGSNMTGTDLCVNKPHCAAAVRP